MKENNKLPPVPDYAKPIGLSNPEEFGQFFINQVKQENERLSTPQPEVKEGEKCNCLITRHFNNVLWDTEKPIEPEKPEHTYKEEVTATIKIDWK